MLNKFLINAELSKNPWLHLILDRPRIIANIAAISRLACAVNIALHVCGPLIFERKDKTRWHSSLDYLKETKIHFHLDIRRCIKLINRKPWLIEIGSIIMPWQTKISINDVLILGPENNNISATIQKAYICKIITFPHLGPARSLNLAQSAALGIYEIIRQIKQ